MFYRIQAILDKLQTIDPMPIGLLLAVVGLLLIFTPRRYYLWLAIASFAAWLAIGRFTSLGQVAAVSKATFAVPLLAVTFAAWMHPGRKNKIPWLYWIYIVSPLWAAVCVMSTTSRFLVWIYLLCSFLSAIAAMQVLRTITDRRSLSYVINAYSAGLVIPLAIIFLAAFIGSSEHHVSVMGRFAPFGAQPNQFIPLLVQMIAMAIYQFHTHKNALYKLLALPIMGILVVALLKTGSRQGIVLAAAILLPYGIVMIRRPIYLVLFLAAAVGGASWVINQGEGSSKQIRRASDFSDSSGRVDIAMIYISDVLPQRPLFGLLGTSGFPHHLDPSIGHSPHNGYLEMLYWGGWSLGLPLLIAVVATLHAIFRLLLNYSQLNIDGPTILILSSAMGSVYLCGFFSSLIYASIDSMEFFHFLLSGLLLAISRDLKNARSEAGPLEMYPQAL